MIRFLSCFSYLSDPTKGKKLGGNTERFRDKVQTYISLSCSLGAVISSMCEFSLSIKKNARLSTALNLTSKLQIFVIGFTGVLSPCAAGYANCFSKYLSSCFCNKTIMLSKRSTRSWIAPFLIVSSPSWMSL